MLNELHIRWVAWESRPATRWQAAACVSPRMTFTIPAFHSVEPRLAGSEAGPEHRLLKPPRSNPVAQGVSPIRGVSPVAFYSR